MKIKIASVTLALVLAAGALSATPAQAAATPGTFAATDTLYMLNCESNSNMAGLGSINPVSLEVTTTAASDCTASGVVSKDGVNTNANPPSYASMGWSPADKKFWALDTMNYSSLVEITPTGVRTDHGGFVGDHPGVNAIAVSPVDGTIYATDEVGSILKADPVTMTLTTIGTPGDGSIVGCAMAYAPDGKLYLVTFSNGSIYTVNTTTGALTLVVDNGMQFTHNNIGGIAFDSNGTLWMSVLAMTTELWSADVNNFGSTAVRVSGNNPDSVNFPGALWRTDADPTKQQVWTRAMAAIYTSPLTVSKSIAPFGTSATFGGTKFAMTAKVKKAMSSLANKIKTSSAKAGKKPTITITYYTLSPVKAKYKALQLKRAKVLKDRLLKLKVSAKIVLKAAKWAKVKSKSAGRIDVAVKY